jgi:sterol desaturase/sphingolipid hydroxylase (fatty acid hydroxylase superfamily)
LVQGSWTPVAMAIPAFFLLIGVEAFVAWRQGRRVYRAGDVVADLGCGVFQQIVGLFARTVLGAGYLVSYATLRVADWPTHWWVTWVLTFILVDLCYYWFHRTSHRVNLLWAAHVVHHQSEDYNLAVALRQGAAQAFFSWAFYVPLAVLGLPPLVFFTCKSINTLYQFWIHTQLVDRLGPLEWVMNTPSHHRVHHGRNPKYIDRNHAGVFIVWDRWFGTFEPEAEAPVYGITHPVDSFDPIRAHLRPWREIWARSRQARGWDRLWVWLKEPGWTPRDVQWHPAKALEDPAYEPSVSTRWRLYALTQFAPLVPLTMGLIYFRAADAAALKGLVAAFAVWTLISLGGVVEGRAWAVRSERVRLVAAIPFAWALGATGLAVWPLVGVASVWAAAGFVLLAPPPAVPVSSSATQS